VKGFKFISIGEAIQIHNHHIQKQIEEGEGGSQEIADLGLLKSAVAQPQSGSKEGFLYNRNREQPDSKGRSRPILPGAFPPRPTPAKRQRKPAPRPLLAARLRHADPAPPVSSCIHFLARCPFRLFLLAHFECIPFLVFPTFPTVTATASTYRSRLGRRIEIVINRESVTFILFDQNSLINELLPFVAGAIMQTLCRLKTSQALLSNQKAFAGLVTFGTPPVAMKSI